MHDVHRQDLMLFMREMARPTRLFATTVVAAVGWAIAGHRSFGAGIAVLFGAAAIHTVAAANGAWAKRFANRRFGLLWNSCQDRHKRFKDALTQMRRKRIAEFEELPKTINAISQALYIALRRADTVFSEVVKSEGWLIGQAPPTTKPPSHDPQAQELYRIADKNIAEYRQHYASVMAGVQRTEAQAAVFTTTLDTLRMKMLGYRLGGRGPEVQSQEFLESIVEAKLQLEAIDKALEELELSPFPKSISILPPATGEGEQTQNLGV